MYYKRLFIQDAGGLPTAGGGAVRPGLLFRSGELYRLRERDLALLRQLKFGQVVDLRQAEVAESRPDEYSAPVTRLMPLRMGQFEELTLQAALRRQVDWARYVFRDLYVIILEHNKDYLRDFLDLLVDGPHPVLLHCTAGKDRTGVFMIVLLLALRVPQDRIIQWYRSIYGHLKKNTPRRARLLVWFSGTPRETLMINLPAVEALFVHLERRYGGIEGCLAESGFTRLEQLRTLFLT
jgi:protein-tyrosine phosphatase